MSESPVQNVNREDKTHLYTQVSDFIRHKIQRGELRAGDAIWPQRELSRLCQVSEITVRRAIQDLSHEGILVSRRGSGTYVTRKAVDRAGGGTVVGRGAAQVDGSGASAGVGGAAAMSDEASGVGRQVGLVVTSFLDGHPFLGEITRGIREALGAGRVLQVLEQPLAAHPHDASPGQADAASSAAGATPIEPLQLDGLLGLLMLSPVNLSLVVRCQERGLPYVLLHNDLSDGASHCVFVDYASGLIEAVEHLHGTGRRRIALVTAAAARASSGRVTAGYRMALRHFDLPTDPQWVRHAGYGELHGYEAGRALLSAGDGERIDAVICGSDYQAKGVLMAANEAGLRVPDDLAVIGMGNVLRPKEAPLELTTIDTDMVGLSRRGMAMLSRMIEGDREVPIRDIVVPQLRVRDSS